LLKLRYISLVARLAAFLSDVLTKPAPFTPPGREDDPTSEWKDELATRSATLSKEATSKVISAPSQTKLKTDGCDRTILIVAHGAAISALVGSIMLDMGLASIAAQVQRSRIWNCSITTVTVDMEDLPLRKGSVDLKPLIKDASGGPFVIEQWAGEIATKYCMTQADRYLYGRCAASPHRDR
jgi:hypothetical protein